MFPQDDTGGAHDERARDYAESRDVRTSITNDKLERLKKLLGEGLTVPVIAERLGVSGRQVRQWKRELRESGSLPSGQDA